jgi:arabinofuranosyltransferase
MCSLLAAAIPPAHNGGYGATVGMKRLEEYRDWVRGCILAAGLTIAVRCGRKFVCHLDGQFYVTLSDDQMISMRYARNLAEGYGLVWNELGDPVEGFSNLLWTLWMAVGHLLPIPDSWASLWIMVTSALALLGTIIVSGKIVERLLPDSTLAPLLAMALTAVYFPLIRWAMFGFEVGWLALVETTAVLVAVDISRGQLRAKNERRLALLFCVALLTRPDALTFVSSITACLLLSAEGWHERRRLALRLILPCVLVTLGVSLFRWSYYGDWLPNTVTLKMTGLGASAKLARGWRSLMDTLTSHLMILVLPMLVALGTGARPRWSRLIVATAIVGELAYTVLMGGDTWEDPGFANRPISAVAPCMFALAGVGLVELGRQFRERVGTLGASALIGSYALAIPLALSLQSARATFATNYCMTPLYQKVSLGVHLRRTAPRDTTIAVIWAGALPYFSRLPAVDILGKSDRLVARLPARNDAPGHNKWDYRYSVGQLHPVVIDEIFGGDPADVEYVRSLGFTQGHVGAWFHPSLLLGSAPFPNVTR